MILFNFHRILKIVLILSAYFFSNGNSQRSSAFKDSGLSKDPSLSAAGSSKYFEVLKQIKKIESEIEAERTSRSGLEQRLTNVSVQSENNSKHLNVLSDTVDNIKNSVDSDANFWNSSDSCGGVVIAQSGRLAYSNPYISLAARSYTFPKLRCIWTVRANYRSNIKVTFIGSTLNGQSGYVTEIFIDENGKHSTKLTNILPLKTYLFNGPVIIVSVKLRNGMFVGHNAISSSVVFEGVGMRVHQDTEFHHFHYSESVGNFNQVLNQSNSISQWSLSKKKVVTTVVINTDRANLAELKIEPVECTNSTLTVQHSFESNTGESQQIRSCCTNGTCPQETYYTLEGWFVTSFSSLKPLENLRMSWNSKGNQSNSINVCGGVLMGKSGKISYKRTSNYQNNERCVWVIYPFPKAAVAITNVVSGMESTYDHLVITEIDKDIPDSTELLPQLRLTNRTFTGRVILVTFYTDPSVVRQGFEISWEAIGDSDHNRRLEDEQIIHKPSESNFISINREASTTNGFSLYLVSSVEQDGSSLSIQLSNLRPQDVLNCDSLKVKMIGSQYGRVGHFYNKTRPTCKPSSTFSLSSPDGIGSVFLEVEYPGLKQNLSLELITHQIPPVRTEENVDECGGVLHTASGRLTYKLDETYANNERCIWIIHAPANAEIELKLLKDAFEECCDYILVNTLNPDNGTLSSDTTVITRKNNTKSFKGPLLIVTFRSDSTVVGKGFTLQYTGKGTLNDHPYTYHIAHRDEPSGSYEYPQLENVYWDSGNGLYGEDEILVVGYSSPAESGATGTSTNFNVTIEDVVLGMDENCNSDILNFYSSPSRDGFHWTESYPKQKCNHQNAGGNCAECVKREVELNDTSHHGFGSSYKAFLAIYKPVKSEFINQSFHAHWEVASGCGGVLIEQSGSISYKLSSKYRNSEQCIWIVHSPEASKIRFNLQNNGFEPCCDYILLNSLNANNGTLGDSAILSTESKMQTVDGPVVFVTFRSDASVTGDGFSLTFAPVPRSSIGSTTQSPTLYDFHVQNGKRRNSSLSFPTHDNDDVEMGKDFILAFAFSPESIKNESFLRPGTKITIDSLKLGFDNETCVSDTLKFYETPTRLGYNATKSYELGGLLAESPCHNTPESIEVFCSECPAGQPQVQQLSILSNYTAFIAIFKSNSNPNGGRDINKGIQFSWTEVPRVAQESQADY